MDAERQQRRMRMLSKMEYRDNATRKTFWTAHPEEFDTDYVYICDVTDEELVSSVWNAEEAYCGDGDSCRTPDELAEFESWLVRCGYSEDTAKRAAEALRKLHADD
jgi:hypothetical protein